MGFLMVGLIVHLLLALLHLRIDHAAGSPPRTAAVIRPRVSGQLPTVLLILDAVVATSPFSARMLFAYAKFLHFLTCTALRCAYIES